jgi:hypothetical protein
MVLWKINHLIFYRLSDIMVAMVRTACLGVDVESGRYISKLLIVTQNLSVYHNFSGLSRIICVLQ